MNEFSDWEARLQRLERSNSRLRVYVAILGVGAVVLLSAGWKQNGRSAMDSLQVHRLEVLDGRGVPVITLSPMRGDAGGTIVLRDQSGDKRSWWETDSGTSRIVFQSPEPKGDESTIAGLAASPGRAQVSLLGPKGASLVGAVQTDQPSVALKNSNGATLFAAPWNK
jgi:hypothetical protein